MRTFVLILLLATPLLALAPPAAAETCVAAPAGVVETCLPPCTEVSCATIPWCSGADCLPSSSHGLCAQGEAVLVGEECILDAGVAPCEGYHGSVVYAGRASVGCIPL